MKPKGKEDVVVRLTGRVVQRKMRLTALDRWTLNLLLPVGRDVISHCRIKKNTQMYTKGAIALSVWFPWVTAWVNRLFEASENWISKAALLFFSVLALKQRCTLNQQV